MNNKILTIVIPTYNMEKYLDKCLTSLIIDNKELMKQLEVLVVIDGAKDRSSEIAHTYQDRFPYTYRVIDKENGNYGSCINRGLKEAKGKYIKILDADDSFDTPVFASFLNDLCTRDEDMILSDYSTVDPDGIVTYTSNQKPLAPYKTFTIDNYWQLLQMHSMTYKTEKVRSINYQQTEGISYTDREWVLWPMKAVETICYIPKVVYLYLVGREGQTVDINVKIKGADQEVIITKKLVKLWSENKNNLGRAKYYIETSLNERLKYLIFNDLNKYGGINQSKYIDMDKFFKEYYPDFYDFSNRNCVLGQRYRYHFLREWRKGYHLNMYNPFVLIYRMLK